MAILFATNWILVRFQMSAMEEELRRTELLVNTLIASKLSELKVQAQLVGELPILNTVVENGDLNTIKDAGRTYRENLGVPIFDIMGRDFEVIAAIGAGAKPEDRVTKDLAKRILRDGSSSTILARDGKLTLMAGAPIGTREDASGVLQLGWELDSTFAGRIRDFTKSEILFMRDGEISGESIPENEHGNLDPLLSKLHGREMEGVRILNRGAYAAKGFSLKDMDGKEVGKAILLMPLSDSRNVLSTLKISLIGIALVILLLACALSYRFSTGFTKPIAAAIRFAQGLASGDRGTPIVVDRMDELGALQDSLEKMRIALKSLIENLDEKVKEGTRHVTNILDNLDSGYLIFNSEGIIQPGYSRISEEYFGNGLEGKKIEEVLASDEAAWKAVEDWRSVLFQEVLSFKRGAKLGPGSFDKIPSRHIELSYRPIYANQKLNGVILIASDKTEERRLAWKFEMEKERVKAILKIAANPIAFVEFLQESREKTDEMERRLKSETNLLGEIPSVLRDLHTIKGNSGMYLCNELKDIVHRLEEDLSGALVWGGSGEVKDVLTLGLSVIRESLDKIANENRALIGSHSNESADIRHLALNAAVISELENALLRIMDRKSEVYTMFVDCLLHEPFLMSLRKYEDLVAELAKRKQKRLKPILWQGDSVKARMQPFKGLVASLVHAFRNAVDHGIESPEEREAAGKDPEGSLWVTVEKSGRESPMLTVRIRDDGRGIDVKKIRRKIEDRKLLEAGEVDRLHDFEVLQYVFKAGFTLSDTVTEISGRGVGMDAIAYEVEAMHGRTWIESILGAGTELFIEIPVPS
ncbi:MAG TPA: ATP-binding protein [Fibrobacteria bacterium]|nr:ATP-binding protein [Fibrobacteria bacterium]